MRAQSICTPRRDAAVDVFIAAVNIILYRRMRHSARLRLDTADHALCDLVQVLVSSAKPFEDFVDEQLRQDGSGLVLRREGATGLLVPRGKTLTQTFVVAPGCCICWEFRVKVRSFQILFQDFLFAYLILCFTFHACTTQYKDVRQVPDRLAMMELHILIIRCTLFLYSKASVLSVGKRSDGFMVN